MTPRRISVITPYFHPEVVSCVPLMASLVEELVVAGHEVEVLTSAPVQWDDGESVATHRGGGVPLRDQYAGASVIRHRNPFARRPGALYKLLEYASLSLWILTRTLFSRRTDAIFIYSNPPLLGLPVAWIAHLRGVPVLYNLQDIFPESAISGGLIPKGSRAIGPLRALERLTYRTVDLVGTISEEFAAHVTSVAPTARVEVVPNWIDTEAVRPIEREENEFLKKSELDGKFVVLYSGNLGFLHGVEALLDAAVLLRDLPDVVIAIVGEGQQREAMMRRAAEQRLENVRFFDFQPFALIPHVYSAGDVCVVPMRRGAVSAAIPSKMWSIMACARPVIAAIDASSELAQLVRSERAGLVTEPEDGAALAAAVRVLHADRVGREGMGANGRRYVEENLGRKRIVGRLIGVLQGLIERDDRVGKVGQPAPPRANSSAERIASPPP